MNYFQTVKLKCAFPCVKFLNHLYKFQENLDYYGHSNCICTNWFCSCNFQFGLPMVTGIQTSAPLPNLTGFVLLLTRLFCLTSILRIPSVLIIPVSLCLPSFKASFLNSVTGSIHETPEQRELCVLQISPLTPASLQAGSPPVVMQPKKHLVSYSQIWRTRAPVLITSTTLPLHLQDLLAANLSLAALSAQCSEAHWALPKPLNDPQVSSTSPLNCMDQQTPDFIFSPTTSGTWYLPISSFHWIH